MNNQNSLHTVQEEDNHHLLRVRLYRPVMERLRELAQEASQDQQEYVSVSDLVRSAIGSFVQVQDTKKRLNVLVNPKSSPKVRKG